MVLGRPNRLVRRPAHQRPEKVAAFTETGACQATQRRARCAAIYLVLYFPSWSEVRAICHEALQSAFALSRRGLWKSKLEADTCARIVASAFSNRDSEFPRLTLSDDLSLDTTLLVIMSSPEGEPKEECPQSKLHVRETPPISNFSFTFSSGPKLMAADLCLWQPRSSMFPKQYRGQESIRR